MSQQIDLVIRQAQIVTPEGVVEGDLGVDGGHIASIGTPVTAARRVL